MAVHAGAPTPSAESDSRPVVLVDASNVRRSRWPAMPPEEVAPRAAAWAAPRGADAVVVFDREAPGGLVGERAESGAVVVGAGRESADDWIARRAAALAAAGARYWLVTSDRGLRARAAGAAERVIGGGAFVRALDGLPFPRTPPGI